MTSEEALNRKREIQDSFAEEIADGCYVGYFKKRYPEENFKVLIALVDILQENFDKNEEAKRIRKVEMGIQNPYLRKKLYLTVH